jgi:hypothetical protein
MEYRELLPEEFHLAPREVEGSEVFTPENSRILAAFNENGEIVSTWTLFAIVHAEPLWVRPDYRNHPTLLKHMNRNMTRIFKESGFANVYTVVLDAVHAKVMTRLAAWFGFTPVKGQLFIWKRS